MASAPLEAFGQRDAYAHCVEMHYPQRVLASCTFSPIMRTLSPMDRHAAPYREPMAFGDHAPMLILWTDTRL